jgi:hypothetical protein
MVIATTATPTAIIPMAVPGMVTYSVKTTLWYYSIVIPIGRLQSQVA